MRRVVITGLGTMNALGHDVESSWARIVRGENGVGPITRFDVAEQSVKFAACIDWDPLKHFQVPDLRKLDPFTMWALVATAEALRDAGLDAEHTSETLRERWGCILGTGIGGITGIELQHTELMERGPRRVSPHFVPKIMANAVSGQVAIRPSTSSAYTGSQTTTPPQSISQVLSRVGASVTAYVRLSNAGASAEPVAVTGTAGTARAA